MGDFTLMATNNFKAFALDPNANVMSQADWEALPALLSGFTAGKASSAQVNKAIRQASFIAAALAQYTSDKTGDDVLDDGDQAAFIAKMAAAFGKDFQPLDATLTALAGLATGANKLPYFTGNDTAALTNLTAVGRDIIGKNTIADIFTYLGLVGGLEASTVGRLIGVKMITSSQTYTPTTGTKLSIVELVGASGGSGGVAATGANTTVVTSPSSQGTYAEFIYPNPTSQVVTIGQGGSAGASGGGNGTSGGNSSFGSLVICPGGQGSYSAVPSAGVIQPAPGSASLAPTVNSGVTLLSSIYNRAVQNALQISTGVATNFGASPQGPMPGTRAGASVDGVYRAINSAAIGGNAGFDGACRIWEYA